VPLYLGSCQRVNYGQVMLKRTLQRHPDHVHLKWFACAVISRHSYERRRGVNEPKSCTNLVALDKVSIKSHTEVDGGVLHIGRSVGGPIERENHG
jgi:hypothetical protein